MRKVLFFAAFVGFMVACGGAEETSDSNTEAENTTASTAEPAAPAVDGEKVYKQNCIACHGLYGDMGASGAFNLQTSELTVEERINVITNGRNTMAAWGSLLSEDQIRAVAEYTTTLKKEE